MRDRLRKEKILVSACLLGIGCRPDGRAKKDEMISTLLNETIYFILCPEILAGFSVPRQRIEIEGGDGKKVLDGEAKVFTEKGLDVTDKIIKAAHIVLEFCRMAGIKKVVFKEKSPSCGKNFIYDGTFSGRLIKGKGVVAALLMREGIEVKSFEEFLKKSGVIEA